MSNDKKTYGPIVNRSLGTLLDTTLGASALTVDANVSGYTEIALAISISAYSSVTQLQGTFKFSYDGGVTWFDVADDDTGDIMVLTKTLTSGSSWVWTVKARAELIRATFTATGASGEAITITGTASSAPIKPTAPQSSGGGGGPVTLHATTHEDGGSDEINVANLSGQLADPQIPLGHHTEHELGGSDVVSIAGLSGLSATPQNPRNHHINHENGGVDEINVAGLSGQLADAQPPLSHHATHENGGADEINVAGLSGQLADAQVPSAHAATHHHSTGSDPLNNDTVGLGNVTNDAQLKRSASDFDTFTLKSTASKDDLVLIEDNSDSLNKKKVPAGQLPNLPVGQTVIVAKSGGEYTTIAAALASITTASISEPWTIIVRSGVYDESPLTMKPYVNIVGSDSRTVVHAINASVPLFTMANNSKINGISIDGPGSSECVSASSGNSAILNVKFVSGRTGISVTGSGTLMTVTGICEFGNSLQNGIESLNGAIVDANSVLNMASRAFYSDNAEMWIHNSGISGSLVGLDADNSGTIFPSLITCRDVSNPVHVGATGTNYIIGNSVTSHGVSMFDVIQESTSSVITLTSCFFSEDKISVVNFQNVNIQFASEDTEQKSVINSINMKNGVAEKGRELQTGEGGHTSRGIMVFEYTKSTDAYVNVTANAQSASSPTFGIPHGATDDALYIAWNLNKSGDKRKFFGILFDTVTALDLGLTGEVETEIWNGSAWISVRTMSAQETGKKLPFTNKEKFQRLGKESIRFNKSVDADWVKNDPVSFGIPLYWARFRIVQDVNIPPVFQYMDVHPSYIGFSEDGWMSCFGKARSVKTIPWDIGLLQAANNSPSNSDIYVSDYLNVGRIENRFQDGTIDRTGFNSHLPFDIDTSCPLTIEWAFTPLSNAVPGNDSVDWVVRWGWTNDGDDVFTSSSAAPTTGPNEQNISVSSIVTARRVQMSVKVELDISEMKSRSPSGNGDYIWVTIQRSGNSDSYNGDVAIINVSPKYIAWSIGGHE